MSYIPNVRDKYYPQFKKDLPLQEHGYWQGYLSHDDAIAVSGYDYAALNAVKSFFCDSWNLDFSEETESDCRISFNDVGLTISEFFAHHDDYFCAIRDSLLEWLEEERNDLVVHFLESMSEEEYERRKEEADKGVKNCLFTLPFEEKFINNGYFDEE